MTLPPQIKRVTRRAAVCSSKRIFQKLGRGTEKGTVRGSQDHRRYHRRGNTEQECLWQSLRGDEQHIRNRLESRNSWGLTWFLGMPPPPLRAPFGAMPTRAHEEALKRIITGSAVRPAQSTPLFLLADMGRRLVCSCYLCLIHEGAWMARDLESRLFWKFTWFINDDSDDNEYHERRWRKYDMTAFTRQDLFFDTNHINVHEIGH